MPKKIKLEGSVFGRLIVIKENPVRTNDGKVRWDCKCDCGNIITTSGGNLRSGDTKSCGCLEHDNLVERNLKHGKCGTREYTIWKGIRQRCYNKNEPHYADYGGRGISVCDRWNESFENFLQDMGLSPSLTHSIDRINNSGNYEPSNCFWATKKEQGGNKRNNRIILFNGKKMILQDWADHLKIPVSTLHFALKTSSFDKIYHRYVN